MNMLHSCSYWSRCFYDVCYWHPILITLHWYLKRLLFLINICKKNKYNEGYNKVYGGYHSYIFVHRVLLWCNGSSNFVIWIPVIYIFIRRFKQKNISCACQMFHVWGNKNPNHDKISLGSWSCDVSDTKHFA